jgi:hypothetical protein
MHNMLLQAAIAAMRGMLLMVSIPLLGNLQWIHCLNICAMIVMQLSEEQTK